jgi:hypothetical protein
MRDQYNAVAFSELVELLQRAVDLDVGIQIGHWATRLAHQVTKQPRLDRGRKLQHRVAHRHVNERVALHLPGREQLERLILGIQVTIEVIDHQRPQPAPGIGLGQRAGQHSRVRRVVLGDDRADVQGRAS